MSTVETKVFVAIVRSQVLVGEVFVQSRNTLRHWQDMGSPVEWEEAIVRLADALIAESKGE